MSSKLVPTQNGKPAAAGVQPSTLAPIERGCIYPLSVFSARTGLGGWALRKARRDGLRVVKVGRCKFVRGDDFAAYLETLESEASDS